MNSKLVEVTVLFACCLALALCSLLSLRTDTGTSLFFAILSALFGVAAFWVIFAGIHRTQKLIENQTVEAE